MNYSTSWNYPTAISTGAGSIQQLPSLCKNLGIEKPVIVTDPGIAKLEMTRNLIQLLEENSIKVDVFSSIKANPSGDNVNQGVDFIKSGDNDGVIAFGGGSALDAAKAIALMVGQNRPIWDFEDIGDNWKRVDTRSIVPVIAVPTTAGTGSEVGRASVITDTTNHQKKIIFHPSMLPQQVILDPELTFDLPPFLTAATGMDALSHNLEALCSPFYHPMAEGIAYEGIKLIFDNLETAVNNGKDVDARMQMLVSSSMGATAFQKGLGGMHALAHPLGALYDAHHGTLNAILMPYVLIVNRDQITQKITKLSRFLDLNSPGFDSFLEAVLELRKKLNIPHTLAEIDIDSAQSKRVGEMAVADPSAGGNPVSLSAQQYSDVFINAVNGKL